jgi:hypothetical protein
MTPGAVLATGLWFASSFGFKFASAMWRIIAATYGTNSTGTPSFLTNPIEL